MTSMLYLLYFTVYTNLPHQPPINVLTVLMAYIKNIMICHEIFQIIEKSQKSKKRLPLVTVFTN